MRFYIEYRGESGIKTTYMNAPTKEEAIKVFKKRTYGTILDIREASKFLINDEIPPEFTEMKLHERKRVHENDYMKMFVTRVIGGWMYELIHADHPPVITIVGLPKA